MTLPARSRFIAGMPSAGVYLDHLSTTPLLPEVRETMMPFLGDSYGSAGSIHQRGLAAREAVQLAREQLAGMVNAGSPDDILFTASGTEAVNLAIKGLTWHPRRKGTHIVCSAIEHPSTLGAIDFLERDGVRCTRVPVDHRGRIDPERVREALTPETFLLVTHAANYDVGTVQSVRELGAIAGEAGVHFLVEANYAGGWLPLDVQALGIDLLTLAPHRFYGPKGTGVLYRHRRARLVPLVHGGSQEWGLRSGTENVAAIAGAGMAAHCAARDLAERSLQVGALQRRIWDGIQREVTEVVLHGTEPGASRLVTHLNLSAAGTEGEGLMLMCDARGIAIGSGTACTLKSLVSSPVLKAMGVGPELAKAAVLVSPGIHTTTAEADQFVEVFGRMVQRLREMSPEWRKPGDRSRP